MTCVLAWTAKREMGIDRLAGQRERDDKDVQQLRVIQDRHGDVINACWKCGGKVERALYKADNYDT